MTFLLIVLAVTASIFIGATIFAIWVMMKVRKDGESARRLDNEPR